MAARTLSRTPVTTFGRRNPPVMSARIHTVVRRVSGADPEQVLQNFAGAKMSQRQRGATEKMGEILVRKAKEYAPKSNSPETGGNMAAGIRMLRISANTIEIVAPPPALWRILGFEATGGLRPWLAKSSASGNTILLAQKDAEHIHGRLVAAMHEDYKEAAHAHGIAMGEHLEQRRGIQSEISDIKRGFAEMEHKYDASAHVMTKEEAQSRRDEIHAQAASIEDEEEKVHNLAAGMEKRSTPHPVTGVARVPMTPERQAKIEALHAESTQMSKRAETLRGSTKGIVAGRTVVHDPAVEAEVRTRVPQLRAAHAEAKERLAANRRSEPSLHEETNVTNRSGGHVPELLRGKHYHSAVSDLKHEIGETEGKIVNTTYGPQIRGSKVRVLQYGSDGIRTTTLQRLLEGAFRYPVGVNFLKQAADDDETKTVIREIAAQMGDAVTTIGRY